MHSLTTSDDRARVFAGTHRVQRVPDGENRRHTSTVTVAVLDADRRPPPPLAPGDIDEQVYRGSGPGGQHRNTSDSCVRVTHRPTGIVVHATASRSQWQNRQAALAELASRVHAVENTERTAQVAAERSGQIGDGGRGGFDWNWCAWRDEVVGPGGRRLRYTAALKGRF